jgi:hypothetical protein
MSDMHHDEWRLATFGERISTMFRVISMSASQLWRLIAVVVASSAVVGLLSGIIETLVNDGSVFSSLVNTLLLILVMIAVSLLSFATYLAIAVIAYRTISPHGVPTWREALTEGFARLVSVIWAALVYAFMFTLFSAGLFGVLSILALVSGTNVFSDNTMIFVLAYVVVLIGIIAIDGYVGFYWLAVIVDNKRGLDAVRYSYQLVKGRWLRVLFNKIGIGVVLYLVFVVGTAISFIPRIFSDTSPFEAGAFGIIAGLGFGLLNLTTYVLTGIGYLVYLTVLYISLQRESEQHTAQLPTV